MPEPFTADGMQPITHAEVVEMWRALKEIAGLYDPAGDPDGPQYAARRARETLEQLGLFRVDDAKRRGLD